MAINLAGRIPSPKWAVSGRWMALGVAVIIIVICAIAYGFKIRIEKQQARKEQQTNAAVATDAARSDRNQTEAADADFSTLPSNPPPNPTTAQPNPAGEAAGALVNAARSVASPYPQQAYSPMQQPVYQETPEQAQYREMQKAMAEHEARLKKAILDSTPIQQTTPTGDPMREEMQRMSAPVQTPVAARMSGDGYKAQNAQDEKQAFGQEPGGETYVKATRVPPVSPWIVQRGTVIPSELPAKIVSDLPGDVIAQVARDVMDTPTQKFVMIPAGSRLVGEYNSNVSYGQNRVQIAWTAIYFEDGTHIDIGRMPAHDASGATGLTDQTDNHWKRVIGGVALSSVLAAGLQISQNRTNGSVLQYPSTGQVAGAAVGTQAAELGQQLTQRNVNIQPRLKIRPGEIFAVSVTRDLIFPGPYQPINGDAR